MHRSLHPILVKNVSGSKIPPFAVMLSVGQERLDLEHIVVKVQAVELPPTSKGKQALLINSSKELETSGDDKYGWSRMASEPFGWVAYDSSDGTPAYGEMWGVRDADFKLRKNYTGFMVSGIVDTSRKRCICTFDPNPTCYFTLTASLAEASDMLTGPTTATATILKSDPTPPGGDLTTGQSITVTNRWEDLSLDSGKRGYAMWDWNLMEWVIVATECP